MSFKEASANAFGFLFGGAYMIIALLYAVAQIIFAMFGFSELIPAFWAGVAVVACLVIGFTLPITIGAFLGALWVFEWPWYGALLFVAPGSSSSFLGSWPT